MGVADASGNNREHNGMVSSLLKSLTRQSTFPARAKLRARKDSAVSITLVNRFLITSWPRRML